MHLKKNYLSQHFHLFALKKYERRKEMKKVVSILMVLSVALCLSACGNDGGNETKSGENSKITTVAAYVDEMKKSLDVGETTVNSKKFELYKFSDKDELTKAKSGTYKFTLKGLESMGEISMQSAVNGDFVLLYEVSDEAAVKAFLDVNL